MSSRRSKMSVATIARFGILTAIALVLGWLEQFIPIAPGIPGIKLGLSNTVLLYALYLMNVKSAFLLMALKVVLSGFLFAGPSAMLYSFAGGLVSLTIMILIKLIPGMSIVGVSVCGAVGHNIGQVTVASLVVQSRAVLGYFPILLVSAVITGMLTGVAAKYALRGLRAYMRPNTAGMPPKQEKES